MNILKEITDEEFNELVVILAERMKNIIYIKAETRSREILTELRDYTELDSNSSLKVQFDIHFLINDALEIIGSIRRKT